MKTTPFPHQQKAIEFHLQRNSSADYSEQGTGKTLVALGVIEERKKRNQIQSALIVCPASILHVWESEIEKHTDLSYVTLKGPHRDFIFERTKADCYIISYDSLNYNIVKIAVQKCQQIVFDEVHKIKNMKAKRTKLSLAMASKIPYRLQLSGTPFPNSLEDVFSLFLILDNGNTFGTNYYRFLNTYFFVQPIYGTRAKKYIPKPILKEILKKAIRGKAIRFTKDELKYLPPKIYQKIPVDLTPIQAKYYARLSVNLPLEEFHFELPPNILAKYEKLQQITSGFLYLNDKEPVEFENPKFKALIDILPNTTARKKTVITCKYRYEIETLKNLLKEYNPLVLYGDTHNKEEVCNKFQNDPKYRVLIMQSQCGIGITLTAADTMIFLSNSFNYADRYQSEDRIHRTGQDSKALYIDIYARGTIDERVIEILEKKRKMISTLLDR